MPGTEDNGTYDEFGVLVEVDPTEGPEPPGSGDATGVPSPEESDRPLPQNDLPPDHVDVPNGLAPDGSEDLTPEQELRDTKERLLRLAADFDNYRKRQERERQDHTRFANERLLKDLLPVLDNLERAHESARRSGESPAIAAGLELVIQEFTRVLHRAGAAPIEAVGMAFDPALHEALQQIESDEVEPGCVAAEILRGYTLNGRVLRPSLVAVGRAPEITDPGVATLDDDKTA